MKKLVLVFTVLVMYASRAQDNLLYLEIGGSAPMLSLNYEGTLLSEAKLNYRVGFGYVQVFDEYITLPIGLSHLTPIGRGNEFELGMGYTFVLNPSTSGFLTDDDSETTGFISPSIGVRIFNGNRNFMFRVCLNPIFVVEETIRFVPYGGVSFGIRL